MLQHRLRRQQDAHFSAVEIETALHIRRIRGTKRTVRRQFNGRACRKRACCHHDRIVVTGHIPRLGLDERIDRCAALHTLAKRHQSLGRSQLDRLDDVGTRLIRGRGNAVSQTGEQRRGVDRRLQRLTDHVRRMEQTHIQGAVVSE